MSAIKFLFIMALAIACVFAAEEVRAKKDVLLGTHPYAYSAPYAYSGYAAPYAYSAGYVPSAYSAAYPAAYPAAYSAYPYNYYRSGLYY